MNAWGIGFCIVAGLGALTVLYRVLTAGERARARRAEAETKAREKHIEWLNKRRHEFLDNATDPENDLWAD